jgi:hypothetical protein
MPETVTLLTSRETAARLRCSERKLERYREVGNGPPFVKFGASVRYPADGLAQWIAARTRHSTSEPAAPVESRRKTRSAPSKAQPQIAAP